MSLILLFRELRSTKNEYDKISATPKTVCETGYLIVSPDTDELTLNEQKNVKQGERFGVELKHLHYLYI